MYTLLILTLSYLIITLFKFNVISTPIDFEETTEKISVIKFESNNDGNGNYNFSYTLSNGQEVFECGEIKLINNKPIIVKNGKYIHKYTRYNEDTGFTMIEAYITEWYADETGYHSKQTMDFGISAGIAPSSGFAPNVLKSLVG